MIDQNHPLNRPKTLAAVVAALVVFSIVAGVVGINVLVQTVLHRSEPVQDAMKRVRSSSAAQQALGPPVEMGTFVTGSLRNGRADLRVPVKGSIAQGELRIVGQGNPKGFTYSTLSLRVGSAVIDLR